jgi:hypothetical protein
MRQESETGGILPDLSFFVNHFLGYKETPVVYR